MARKPKSPAGVRGVVPAQQRSALKFLSGYVWAHATLLAALGSYPLLFPISEGRDGEAFATLLSAALPIGAVLSFVAVPILSVVTVRGLWRAGLKRWRVSLVRGCIAGLLATLLFAAGGYFMWGNALWQNVGAIQTESAFWRALGGFSGGNLLLFLGTLLSVYGADIAPLQRAFGRAPSSV